MREVSPSDAGAIAEFLDRTTDIHRWLVAFYRNFNRVSAAAMERWGLWFETMAGPGARAESIGWTLAHSFETGVTYLAAGHGLEREPLESLLKTEVFPERLVGDLRPLETWEAMPGSILRRSMRREELLVLRRGAAGGPIPSPEPSGFRPARREDLPRLTELERLSAQEQGEDSVLSELVPLVEREMLFVLEEGGAGEIAGVMRSNLSDGKFVHLGGLFVDPRARGRGVARRLVAGLAGRIERQGLVPVLDVDRGNLAAIAVYRSVGFRDCGAGRVYVFPEDAWRAGG